MRNTTQFKLTTLSAAVASTLISGYATAQKSTLEEVIVTATRRAESIQDIPINIRALGSDLIERERLSNLSDVARRVPGLTLVDQGPRSANIITVRGLNVNSIAARDGTNDGGDTVGVYIGDIPLYADFRLSDLDRVEVLIGPQGTLYGAGTLGGAVRYIPNKPQADEFSAQISGDVFDLSKSDDHGYEAGATINVPIIDDKLAFRASAEYYDDPGFIDYNFLVREPGVSNPQPDFNNLAEVQANLKQEADANTEETLYSRAALRWVGDIFDGTLTYHYQEAKYGARQINHREAFGTGRYESAHRYLEPKDRENELLSLELIFDLGFAELTAAGGISSFEEKEQRDQTDLLLNFEYGYELFPAFASFTRDTSEEDRDSAEVRLVSKHDGPFNWIVGGFYNKKEIDALALELTPGYDQFAVDNLGGVALRPDAIEYYQKTDQETREVAVFGELGYEITDAWQITIGARWFEYKDEVTIGLDLPLFNTVFDGAPPDAIAPNFDSGKVKEDDIVYKFNTSYEFSDDVMAYFTFSEGYRLGSFNGLAACPDPLPPNVQNVCALSDEFAFETDTTLNYEIGVHSQINDSLILNGAIYFIEWDDVQIDSRTDNGDIPITSNGGSAETKGFEVNTQYFITPEFSIGGAYSFTDAELTDDAEALVDGEDAFDGDRLPGSPKHQVYLTANYTMGLNDGTALDLDWSMTAQSDVLTKVGNRASGETLRGFALHNVSATWTKDDLKLTLYADNVFDRYAETGVRGDTSFIRTVGDFDLRRYYHNVVRPRQVGLRFTYDF